MPNNKRYPGALGGIADAYRIKMGLQPLSKNPTTAFLKAVEALKPKKSK